MEKLKYHLSNGFLSSKILTFLICFLSSYRFISFSASFVWFNWGLRKKILSLLLRSWERRGIQVYWNIEYWKFSLFRYTVLIILTNVYTHVITSQDTEYFPHPKTFLHTTVVIFISHPVPHPVLFSVPIVCLFQNVI